MALIKFSAVVGAASGKSGGVVFSRNRGGSYIRSWAKGVDSNTPLQLAQRSKLTAVTQQWKALTNAQRTAWVNAASEKWHQVKNRLGEDVVQSGFQYFLKTNMAGATIGAPLVVTPSLPQDTPYLTITGGEMQGPGGDVEIAFQADLNGPDPLGADFRYVFRINRPTPQGRKVKADRILAVIDPASGDIAYDPITGLGTVSLPAETAIDKFGDYPVGSQFIASLTPQSIVHPWDVLAAEMAEGTTV